MASHKTIQTLIDNIDGPLAMLERKERMGRIVNPAPATSILPMLRPREFEDSVNISDADRDLLVEKHTNPSPQPRMRLNPQALEFQAQAATNWGNQWTMADWMVQQSGIHQYEHSEWEHGSLGTGSLGTGSYADSSQYSGNEQTPEAGYSAENGYDFGHASFYAPISQDYLQQQPESQLYGFYQAYNQGYAADSYTDVNSYSMEPTQSAQETFGADFYGLPFTVEAMFPLAPEYEQFAATLEHENFPTLPAGLSESISEACLWSVVFGSYEEDNSLMTEEEIHRMRFVPWEQVFDPADESLRFGELKFSTNGTTLNTILSDENVEDSPDKTTEEMTQNNEDSDPKESEQAPIPTPEPSPELVRNTDSNAPVGGPVSLNSLFNIAGPGNNADGNTRGERAAPTTPTTPTTTNAQRGRRSWAAVVRSRKT